MKKHLSALALALSMAFTAAAQTGQPQPKTQEELDAVLAIQNASGPDERIAAAEKLLKDFADTEFKEYANYMTMLSYQQLNDFENMLIFGERTLDINPDNVGVLLQLSFAIPSRTREFDLDKEEKLAKAEDFAKRAISLVPNMPKPSPEISDDDWLLSKKDFMSQANESLGLVEMKRENHEAAAEHFQKSLDLAPEQSAQTFFYLAQSYKNLGKKTEALSAIESCIANGGFPLPNGTDAAQALKAEIEKAE